MWVLEEYSNTVTTYSVLHVPGTEPNHLGYFDEARFVVSDSDEAREAILADGGSEITQIVQPRGQGILSGRTEYNPNHFWTRFGGLAKDGDETAQHIVDQAREHLLERVEVEESVRQAVLTA